MNSFPSAKTAENKITTKTDENNNEEDATKNGPSKQIVLWGSHKTFSLKVRVFFRKNPLSFKSRASTHKTGFSRHLLAFATFSLDTLYGNTYVILDL